MKISTKKTIDISHYSEINKDMKKLMFKGIKVTEDNPTLEYKMVTYNEYAILGDPIITPIPRKDENGNNVFDENGNQVFDNVTEDNVKYLRTIPPFKVSYDEWDAMKDLVYQNLPNTMPKKEKYKTFLKEGIKNMIVTKGFYHGQFSLTDFE